MDKPIYQDGRAVGEEGVAPSSAEAERERQERVPDARSHREVDDFGLYKESRGLYKESRPSYETWDGVI